MLKMFPSSLNAVSIQVEHIIYSLEFLRRNQTQIFFFMKRELCEQVLDFLHSNSGCFENSPFHIRKMRLREGKTLNVGQLLHLYTDWKKPVTKMYSCNQIVFLQSTNY